MDYQGTTFNPKTGVRRDAIGCVNPYSGQGIELGQTTGPNGTSASLSLYDMVTPHERQNGMFGNQTLGGITNPTMRGGNQVLGGITDPTMFGSNNVPGGITDPTMFGNMGEYNYNNNPSMMDPSEAGIKGNKMEPAIMKLFKMLAQFLGLGSGRNHGNGRMDGHHRNHRHNGNHRYDRHQQTDPLYSSNNNEVHYRSNRHGVRYDSKPSDAQEFLTYTKGAKTIAETVKIFSASNTSNTTPLVDYGNNKVESEWVNPDKQDEQRFPKPDPSTFVKLPPTPKENLKYSPDSIC